MLADREGVPVIDGEVDDVAVDDGSAAESRYPFPAEFPGAPTTTSSPDADMPRTVPNASPATASLAVMLENCVIYERLGARLKTYAPPAPLFLAGSPMMDHVPSYETEHDVPNWLPLV